MRSIPFLLALAVLASCTAAPTPSVPVAPLKRSAAIAPSPLASASPAPVSPLGFGAVQRMQRVGVWVKHQGDGYEMSLLFFDAQDNGIFFDNEPIVLGYTFLPGAQSTAIATGTLTMSRDSQVFPLSFKSPPGPSLDCDLTARLPDGRVLHTQTSISIQ